jgi:hypothetical protein
MAKVLMTNPDVECVKKLAGIVPNPYGFDPYFEYGLTLMNDETCCRDVILCIIQKL